MRFFLVTLLTALFHSLSQSGHVVNVYHYLDKDMGHPVNGVQSCMGNDNLVCEWHSAKNMTVLQSYLQDDTEKILQSNHNMDVMFNDNDTSNNASVITVFVANIHQWVGDGHSMPNLCEFPANLTMADTEESRAHRKWREEEVMEKNFDAFSTTQNTSTLQRAYKEAVIFNESFLLPGLNYSDLIKGASFIASNCAYHLRNSLVIGLRDMGFRVDGLGRCLHTGNNSEGISLDIDEEEDLLSDYKMKKHVLSKYMFHLAFENDIESWHVTEKAYHALHAGTVPVYLGPAEDFKVLLPDPMAAIFVHDFNYNATELAVYLLSLTQNETAYELHRAWRHTFSRANYIIDKPVIITKTWHCRVCEWALTAQPNPMLHNVKCNNR